MEAVKRAIFGVYLLRQCVYGKMFLFVQIKRVITLESLLALFMQHLTATTSWLFFFLIPQQGRCIVVELTLKLRASNIDKITLKMF